VDQSTVGSSGWDGQQRAVDLAEPIQRYRGVCAGRRPRRWGVRNGFRKVLLGLQLIVGLLQLAHVLLHERIRDARIDDTARHERARPDLAHRRMLGDLLVHRRLREPRFVSLVVAPAAVADEIDEEVAAEARAVGDGETRRFDAGDRVVRVHVHDRNLEAARETARV
jgi:hypothetical protein